MTNLPMDGICRICVPMCEVTHDGKAFRAGTPNA